MLAASQPVRDNRRMSAGESTIELLLRIITGVLAACAAIATLLSSIWVPWAIITIVSVACFGVLLMRARARHSLR